MDIVDSDGDGISDAFELGYVGNLTTMDSTSDYDKDGQTDKAEYIAGTDPLNPNSALAITRISKVSDANAVELEWASCPARVYSIDAKLSLTDTNWLYLDTIPGAGGNTTIQGVEMGAPQAFFRIGVKLPLQP